MGTLVKKNFVILASALLFISNVINLAPSSKINRSPNEHETAPSSRPVQDPHETWSFWGRIRSKDLALDNPKEKCAFIKSVLHHSVEKIPVLNLEEVSFRKSEAVLEAECSKLTKAQLARYSIRLNLARFKAQIIQDVLELFKQNLPKSKPTESSELEIANELADAYIAIVDTFLKDHPGAKPNLGKRIEFLGLQNEFNAPWCADWAQGVLQGLMDRFPPSHPINKWLRFEWAQFKSPEHNFIIIYPRGYPPKMPPEKNSRTLLLLDPWQTIKPHTYFPGDPTWLGGSVPTNLGIE